MEFTKTVETSSECSKAEALKEVLNAPVLLFFVV